MSILKNPFTFDITGSQIKIKLDSKYFKKPVPVNTIVLLDTEISINESYSEANISQSIQRKLESKKNKVLAVEDPIFKFECVINERNRTLTAYFKYQDYQLYITKIMLAE